ncbi:MAG: FmdB family zinc ribbon protein [Balneolaceae bacterium]
MPTYEYKREDGTIFEIMHGMSDKPLTTCPTTGQSVKRIISGGNGIVYKGTGFYNTDYKDRKDSNGSAKKDSGESKKPDSGTSE